MNYIKHLNEVFKIFQKDSRLNASHISLYMALFQFWNYANFKNPFFFARAEIMAMAKLGASKTYYRCLKNLHDWQYIQYFPSHNPYKGSRVKMYLFDPTRKQVGNHKETSRPPAVAPILNTIKHNKNINKPTELKEVLEFFSSKGWPVQEAKKYYEYNENKGWNIPVESVINDWQALARQWMLKTISPNTTTVQLPTKTTLKNYEHPL